MVQRLFPFPVFLHVHLCVFEDAFKSPNSRKLKELENISLHSLLRWGVGGASFLLGWDVFVGENKRRKVFCGRGVFFFARQS